MIISCQNISKSFVGEELFSDISFNIEEKEKVAVVGENGCGKTTLMKIMLGIEPSDFGTVSRSKDLKIGYMAQIIDEEEEERTVYESLLSAKQPLIDAGEELRRLENEIQNLGSDTDKLDEHARLLTLYDTKIRNFEAEGGLTYLNEVNAVMNGLGFSDEEGKKSVSRLSGGQKTRILLGKLLLSKPDILFLDEPTNHLDVDTVRWLENYLTTYDKAVMLISHDRYFIDRFADKIIDIDNRKARVYTGNYTTFLAKKKEILKAEMKAYENDQRMRKHEEEVIKKLKQFNREKSIKRAESREKLLEKREVVDKPVTDDDSIRLTFKPALLSGNDVLTVTGLKKSFKNNLLFEDLSFELKRGEHVALIGNNGTGKSTILKLIEGIVPADEGRIKKGTNVMTGYYDQEHHNLNESKTVFEEIQDEYPKMSGTKIRNMLSTFLFIGDDVFTRIGDLSGGERGRVSLLKLMLSNANFLLLDEPTNHLDLKSVAVLEEALDKYEGTVLFVSHDRYFINKNAKRILNLDDKKIYDYPGNYDYFIEKSEELRNSGVINASNGVSEVKADTTAESDNAGKTDWKKQKEEAALLRKHENTLKRCEKEIEELEEKIKVIGEKMCRPEIATDSGKLNDLAKESAALQERLDAVMEEWEAAGTFIFDNKGV